MKVGFIIFLLIIGINIDHWLVKSIVIIIGMLVYWDSKNQEKKKYEQEEGWGRATLTR